ncbi:tight adherence protein C [Thermanaeromonas toyohensis ToBE]|uniref:Tight adherence protein C n=1 Tax=Thermanaeromonas toyohensis ToBE TaxID=698762 RepID=A0A1W1VP80_9FIRM|nr:type II secretion system F family protein [Thermanaeromonas toyohensis]SMB94871.1 tight adherence protein C [Thermanaeromonas toyohensis ToBE]
MGRAVIAVEFLATILTLALALSSRFSTRAVHKLEKIFGNTPGRTPREEELKLPFYSRIVKPLLHSLSHKIIKILPAKKEAELYRKIIYAHLQGKLSPRELLVLKYLTSGLCAAGAAGISIRLLEKPGLWASLIVGGWLAGWYFLDIYLEIRSKARQRAIEKALPGVLDLLTVSVEAGLSLDSALLKVVEKSKGPLTQELAFTLQEIRMGKGRAQALRSLADRTGVEELASFTSAIILADQLGLSIGNVLRFHAQQMRLKRQKQAEEAAMKAPVKMLFPLVFFIFPALFVVLLGPALIRVVEYFLD